MHKYSVQFRLSGQDLIPSEITDVAGLQPNQIRIVGTKRSERDVWRESLWSYDGVSGETSDHQGWESLEDGLNHLLDNLEVRKECLTPYIKRFAAIWWCGHFQSSFDGGPLLSAKLLRRLADFGVDLYIDNYFSGSSDMSKSSP